MTPYLVGFYSANRNGNGKLVEEPGLGLLPEEYREEGPVGADPVELYLLGLSQLLRADNRELSAGRTVPFRTYIGPEIDDWVDLRRKELKKKPRLKHFWHLKKLVKFFKYPNLRMNLKTGDTLELIDFKSIKPDALRYGPDTEPLAYVARIRVTSHDPEEGQVTQDYLMFYDRHGNPAKLMVTDAESRGKGIVPWMWNMRPAFRAIHNYVANAFSTPQFGYFGLPNEGTERNIRAKLR